MDDPVPVALKGRAGRALRFVVEPAAAVPRMAGMGRQQRARNGMPEFRRGGSAPVYFQGFRGHGRNLQGRPEAINDMFYQVFMQD